MRLSLSQIRNYSICPNFSAFSKDSFPLSFRLKIIEKVIKSSYLQMMETGFKVDWRRIVGWVDTLVIRGVEGDFSQVKREAEVILVFLQKWYDKDYIVNQELGYVDLELEASVLHSVIEERISLVRVPGPSLLLLGDKPLTDTQLYNNIYYRGLAWLVYNSISCSEVRLNYLALGTSGGMEKAKVSLDGEAMKRTGTMIEQIVGQIEKKVYYPSVTPLCESCSFKRKCRL